MQYQQEGLLKRAVLCPSPMLAGKGLTAGLSEALLDN